MAKIDSMLWALILSSLGCMVLLWIMLRFASRLPQDVPNQRSLHERPVPRTGGIALLGGAGAALAAGVVPLSLSFALALGLAAVSYLDDLHRLSTVVRLAAHLGAAGVFVWYILTPMHPLELALLCIAVAWITNLYNFMDGSDGLAAGMSLIGFGAYALAASAAGDTATALLCTALAGASAAFLAYNFHPARVFLGDVGSIPLGFLAGSLGIVGWRNDAWPLWFPLLVFGPFIGDATMTVLKRLVRGERVWIAHRDHYYQRMIRMGLGHRRTACIGYLVMIACAAAALIGREKAPAIQAAVFAGATVFLASLAILVDWRWARHVRISGAGA